MVNCGDCKYWIRENIEDLTGECRRNSPLPILSPKEAGCGCWPLTVEDDCCGDGAEKEIE